MKIVTVLLAAWIFLAVSTDAFAAVHYVDLKSPSPSPPFVTWATAATNIQDAIDAATAGDEVSVTNGIYTTGGRVTMTNCVIVDKPLILQSIKGPHFTSIDGSGTLRCVYLADGSIFSGFTLTNGYADNGGGLFCESTNVVVCNCVIIGNSASDGGGAYGGALINCTLTGNSAALGGGASGSTLNCCNLSSNSTSGFYNPYPNFVAPEGGGAYNCTLNNSTLIGNTSFGGFQNSGYGGGTSGCKLNNCTLIGNGVIASGAVGGGAISSILNNCTLTGNFANGIEGIAVGGGAELCTLTNCTLTGNSALEGGGAYGSTLNNCIVYFNVAVQSSNYDSDSILNFCCTSPLPTNGVGNIANTPLFVNQSGDDFHLQSNSPCINSGNNAYVTTTNDLEGNPRIAGGTVDIGAYEFQTPSSVISYAWLQRYGLPTDGSADYLDLDKDGMNNWQEWQADTDPTNFLSVLKLLSPVQTINPVGIVVAWQSVAGVNYFLQRSTNLPDFTPIATDIPGQIGTTSYDDTNAVGSGPFYYRVGVGN